jgi:hypothetical protein
LETKTRQTLERSDYQPNDGAEFWPNRDPLGKQIKFAQDGSEGTIVGVVGDAKHYWLEEEQRPQLYGAYSQDQESSRRF